MALTANSARRGTPPEMAGRLNIGTWLMVAAFLVLLWRLYALQILRGEELQDRGEQNFAQRVQILHDRGIIYDRYGRILVDNRPSLNLTVTPHFLGAEPAAEATLERLRTILGFSDDELLGIRELLVQKRGLERFRPVVVRRDLDPIQVEAIESDRSIFLLDGVDVVEGRRRTYRYGKTAAHLLGFVNEISRTQLQLEQERQNPQGYERGDLLGREGVEHQWEKELRGRDGWEKVVVDAKGRRVHNEYVGALLGVDHRQEPQPGHNVYLTIDLDLQTAAEEAFDGQAGAVVALDPRTAEVLAMVSVPGFDPNLVSGALALEEKARLDGHPLKPWVNRVLQGQYSPGSTFKIATALAALANKATAPTERVYCPGFYRMGRRAWRCHKDSGHGALAFREAMKLSCDTYFYTMAARLGIDPIAAAARSLGLGRRTEIRLRGEQPGLIPDEAFHNRVDAATGGYQRGMVLNTAIGQGSVLVTPMQLALAYSVIANRGALRTPQTVRRIETADFRVMRRLLVDGSVQEEIAGKSPELIRNGEVEQRVESLPVPPEVWESIHSALVAVTQDPGGTAYWKRSHKTTMAGKTGTAQVIRLGRDRLDTDEMAYEERDHAWFVAYAPIENPEILVAVLNEHSGHGGSAAAPIAVKVIDAYVDLQAQRAPRAQLEGAPATP